MNGIFLFRIARDGVWLAVTLACITFFQKTFFNEIQPFNGRDLLILGPVMLAGTLVTELMPQEERDNSFFRCSLIFLLAVSAALALLSQVPNLATPNPSLVLASLLTFLSFRGFICLVSRPWNYPAFLSTKVMLLGGGDTAEEIRNIIKRSRGRFTLKCAMPLYPPAQCEGENHGEGEKRLEKKTQQVWQDEDRIYRAAKKAGIQTIIVSFPERRGVMPVEQILKCRMLGIRIIEAQAFYEYATRKMFIEDLKPSNIIFSSGFCLSATRRAVKRIIDIFGAAFGLVLFSPLFPIIALAIRLDSPGPVFFRQVRTGRRDLPFHIIKFRTMCNDAEKNSGAVWASEQDPRVTSVGSFLRRTRLDEIPQLLNVLSGEMSLVGPRPERPEFIIELKKSIPFYGERHYIKPGVTGWAQVLYPYGASVEDALEKLRYDLYYIKNQSLQLEFEIILRTILVIFTRRGAR